MKWVVVLFTYQNKAEYLDKEESYYSSTKEGTVYCNFNLSLQCNKKALDKISFHKNTLKGFESDNCSQSLKVFSLVCSTFLRVISSLSHLAMTSASLQVRPGNMIRTTHF